MKQLPTIELERLILRPFSLEDAPVVQELAGDKYIAEMTLNIPYPYEDGLAEEWIGTHVENFHERGLLTLAIVHNEGDYVIGSISLGCNKKFDHGEIAYWIGREYKNNGYCTEAAKGIVKYGFEELHIHRIFARHLGKNPASGKVMEKLGMRYEGSLRQHVRKWGEYEDLLHYGILKDEFLSTSK